MARRIKRETNAIVCKMGRTYLTSTYTDAIYEYRWWFIRLNPRLLPPAWRKDHRKIIIVNGRKRGYAEIRGGLVPLSQFDLPGQGLRRAVLTFIRKTFGCCCNSYERGYTYVKVVGFEFAVLQRTTEKGLRICEVYDLKTEDQIGAFTFNQDFTEVYPYCSCAGFENTMHVIMGYVADSLIYNLAAVHLTREIKIIV